MKDTRIVFMGTPDFAVASLEALYDKGSQIVGVITAPDRPAGRGRKLKQSAVKEFALAKGLNLMQPKNLKDPEFIGTLKNLKPDIQVVVAFRMLPRAVWEIPRLGTFNLHASLLPQYRGAAPINWAIINGEEESGVSTFFINEAIDEGALIYQEKATISNHETAGELHDKLMHLGSELVLKTVKSLIDQTAPSVAQESERVSLAPKLNKTNCRINWNKPVKKVYNLIRGLSPYPAAWTELVDKGETIEIKIYKSEILDEKHKLEPGTLILSKKNIKVALTDGTLEILEIKMAGKRKMETQNFLNGYEFSDSPKFI